MFLFEVSGGNSMVFETLLCILPFSCSRQVLRPVPFKKDNHFKHILNSKAQIWRASVLFPYFLKQPSTPVLRHVNLYRYQFGEEISIETKCGYPLAFTTVSAVAFKWFGNSHHTPWSFCFCVYMVLVSRSGCKWYNLVHLSKSKAHRARC